MGRDDARIDRLLRLPRGAGAACRAAKLAGVSRQRCLRGHLFHRLARGSSVADRRRQERASCPALGLRTLAALGSQSRHAVCVSFRCVRHCGAEPIFLRGAWKRSLRCGSPGIAGITRHPLLWAFTLWALAHMAPNGDLAHVLLFGLFAVFGIAGMSALDRRKRKQWGADYGWFERRRRLRSLSRRSSKGASAFANCACTRGAQWRRWPFMRR